MKLQINERIVGDLLGNDILIIHRSVNQYARKFGGFWMDEDVLIELQKHGIRYIHLNYHYSKRRTRLYITTPERWQERGILFKHLNFPTQLILKEADFEKVVEVEE